MARVCNRHPFLLSENLCGRCGLEFCRDCLVYPRGQKLPLCVTCAVAKAGVRSADSNAVSWRAIRALRKERQKDVSSTATPPLPEIANPVPAGWALDEDLPLDAPKRSPKGGRSGRDAERPTDAISRRLGRSVSRAAPAVDGHDGHTWLDSLHLKD
jgi:hypothetical protein